MPRPAGPPDGAGGGPTPRRAAAIPRRAAWPGSASAAIGSPASSAGARRSRPPPDVGHDWAPAPPGVRSSRARPSTCAGNGQSRRVAALVRRGLVLRDCYRGAGRPKIVGQGPSPTTCASSRSGSWAAYCPAARSSASLMAASPAAAAAVARFAATRAVSRAMARVVASNRALAISRRVGPGRAVPPGHGPGGPRAAAPRGSRPTTPAGWRRSAGRGGWPGSSERALDGQDRGAELTPPARVGPHDGFAAPDAGERPGDVGPVGPDAPPDSADLLRARRPPPPSPGRERPDPFG